MTHRPPKLHHLRLGDKYTRCGRLPSDSYRTTADPKAVTCGLCLSPNRPFTYSSRMR